MRSSLLLLLHFPFLLHQFGTCLIAAASDTKAVLVQSKGTASLKAVVEELIRLNLENASSR